MNEVIDMFEEENERLINDNYLTLQKIYYNVYEFKKYTFLNKVLYLLFIFYLIFFILNTIHRYGLNIYIYTLFISLLLLYTLIRLGHLLFQYYFTDDKNFDEYTFK